jgi:uncharacterized alkaline shock family protein YloU
MTEPQHRDVVPNRQPPTGLLPVQQLPAPGPTQPGPTQPGSAQAGPAYQAPERLSDFATDAAERLGDTAERAAAASGRVTAQMVDRLRNNAELSAERGTTIIANEVVEKIAGIAAREVPGVHDLGGDVSRVFSAVKERIGLGHKDNDQGISVRLDGGKAAVKVTLVIEYGFVVYSVTEQVRANVIGAVEKLLNLEVTAVDIVVDDVHVPDNPASSAELGRMARLETLPGGHPS